MRLNEARGDWALITGASSGIGREFAIQLASAAVNTVLIARREHLLKLLSGELSERFGVKSLIIAADFAKSDVVPHIRTRLCNEGIRPRLLVNNAAFGRWGAFEKTQPDVYAAMIEVNVRSMVLMCHYFLDDLSSFPSSAVINVSSQAAYNPIPYMAVYAATKAFVSSFSQALYGEWKERGIHVQTLVPGPTETEFDIIAGAYASSLKGRGSAIDVVRTSLAYLSKDKPVASHARGTFKQRMFAGLFPPKMVISTVAGMFRPPKESSDS